MFVDIYLLENPKNSPEESWDRLCKEEDLFYFRRDPVLPSRLCEEEMKEALSLVCLLQSANDIAFWEQSEEKIWAERYQIPVFHLQYQRKKDITRSPEDTNVPNPATQKNNITSTFYHDYRTLRGAIQNLGHQLRGLMQSRYLSYGDLPSKDFEFQVSSTNVEGYHSPKGRYSGSLFCEEQPMGRGVFHLICQDKTELYCCGTWNSQKNGDFFALNGKIFQQSIETPHLLYTGDYFISSTGQLLFMDSKATCYKDGNIIYRGGIYGHTLKDFCLRGETFLEQQTFSGYYSNHGTRIYGTLKEFGDEIYHGTFHKEEKEGFGKVSLGEGKQYTGQFMENNVCGQGTMEYQGKDGKISVFGLLPKEKKGFSEISQITSSDGVKRFTTATALSFPLTGQVKIEYSHGLSYMGEFSYGRKTEGTFRKGTQQWIAHSDYGQMDEVFLRDLLLQLDEEESWWALAFRDSEVENMITYHLELCALLQDLHHGFSKKSVEFPELDQYPYESTQPWEHLKAYLQLKPSERIHLCVYALEAIVTILQTLDVSALPFPMVIHWTEEDLP